ncbi:MAG: hypothetical protein V2I33_22650, partial [Kangiellaceae bacterium]|nr:hypothetical protein [Kangiellaceae bacterium]
PEGGSSPNVITCLIECGIGEYIDEETGECAACEPYCGTEGCRRDLTCRQCDDIRCETCEYYGTCHKCIANADGTEITSQTSSTGKEVIDC